MPIGRKKLTIALSIVVAIAGITVAGTRVAAEMDAERIFREARDYTVRIRTRVETPFMNDPRGSFQGAGFLVDAARGWIVTNAHVVGQSPSTIEVAFADGVFQAADKVYVDPFEDIAVIAIDHVPDNCRVARLDRREVRVGEAVGAFGHPLGMYFTGTRGIVSGHTDQTGPDLIQIDATVDHGNSGGPTIALRDGGVVGIATAMTRGHKEDRVNFATPITQAIRILDLLRAGTIPSPPRLRIALLRDDTESHTMEVARSFDRARWPLEPGDRIVSVEGAGNVTTLSELCDAMRGRTQPLAVVIERGGKRSTVRVTPELAPQVISERGLNLDGALIAPVVFVDGDTPARMRGLYVHSIEPGSAAEIEGLEQFDQIETIDGRAFDDLDALRAYVEGHRKDAVLKVVVARTSPYNDRWDDYHVRELPGEVVERVGAPEERKPKQG